MITLFIVSPQPYSGKSLLSLLLGMRFLEEGKRVGYIKPVGLSPVKVAGICTDDDAVFINNYLDLKGPLDLICPLPITSELVNQIIQGKIKDLAKKVREAFDGLSVGRDIMLVGGAGSFATGFILGLPSPRIAELLDAKVLLVIRYDSDLSVENIFFARELFREHLIGTVINSIPRDREEYVRKSVLPYIESTGVNVLGAIPSDETLNSVSVGELADYLGGQVLCCEDRLDELCERFMIGAMNVESALRYFRKAANKAVITGGDRPDIQLAALETPTKCVILSGNLYPTAVILAKAQEVGVPMILVSEDTLSIVQRIESLLGKPKIKGEKKIQRGRELFMKNVDFERLCRVLGFQMK
ncbi:MAG TPA: phosphotransacetylase family protein [Candidatus Latescibacteria bacterium]|nr:phosphotransacetylase family protein [Candidatus Latescibacterota bacterium]